MKSPGFAPTGCWSFQLLRFSLVGIAIFAWIVLVPALDADIISLRGGKKLIGKFVRFDGDKAVIQTKTGRRLIPTADIVSVRVGQEEPEESDEPGRPAEKPSQRPDPKSPEVKKENKKETEKPARPAVEPKPKPKPKPRVNRQSEISLTTFIPAYPQFASGAWGRGSVISFALVGIAAGGAAEFAAAEAAEARARQNLLYHALIDKSERAEFERHQANQAALGVAAFLVYCYHLIDAIWFLPRTGPDSAVYVRPVLEFGIPNRNGLEGGQGIVVAKSKPAEGADPRLGLTISVRF